MENFYSSWSVLHISIKKYFVLIALKGDVADILTIFSNMISQKG